MSTPTFDKDLNMRRLMAAQGSLAVVVNSEPDNILAAAALRDLNAAIAYKLTRQKPE